MSRCVTAWSGKRRTLRRAHAVTGSDVGAAPNGSRWLIPRLDGRRGRHGSVGGMTTTTQFCFFFPGNLSVWQISSPASVRPGKMCYTADSAPGLPSCLAWGEFGGQFSVSLLQQLKSYFLSSSPFPTPPAEAPNLWFLSQKLTKALLH